MVHPSNGWRMCGVRCTIFCSLLSFLHPSIPTRTTQKLHKMPKIMLSVCYHPCFLRVIDMYSATFSLEGIIIMELGFFRTFYSESPLSWNRTRCVPSPPPTYSLSCTIGTIDSHHYHVEAISSPVLSLQEKLGHQYELLWLVSPNESVPVLEDHAHVAAVLCSRRE